MNMEAILPDKEEYPNFTREDDGHDSLYCLNIKVGGEKASTYEEAIHSEHRDEWRKSMESEMKLLNDHYTWKLVQMQSSHKEVGYKWVFRIKRDPTVKFIGFKARLVAKGYTKRPGIEYTETFAPVAWKETINIVLSITAEQDIEAENVDVDTAFL